MEKQINSAFRQFRHNLGVDFDQEQMISWAQQYFTTKQFKFSKISLDECEQTHLMMSKKYQEMKIVVWPDQWHKNQRKLFVQILFCFCKHSQRFPEQMNIQDWQYLSSILFKKNPIFLKFQAFSILKFHNKIHWTTNDDQMISQEIKKNGEGNWNNLSKIIFYQSLQERFFSSKQIRERWFNHISKAIKKGPWSEQEDILLLQHVLYRNNHWCQIVRILNKSRTQHMIKNRFRLLMKIHTKNSANIHNKVGELVDKIKTNKQESVKQQFCNELQKQTTIRIKQSIKQKKDSKLKVQMENNQQQYSKCKYGADIQQNEMLRYQRNSNCDSQKIIKNEPNAFSQLKNFDYQPKDAIIQHQNFESTTSPKMIELNSKHDFMFPVLNINTQFWQNSQFFIWLPNIVEKVFSMPERSNIE